MPQNIAALKISLRVLTAIMDRVDPVPEDLKELRDFAPEYANLPDDDLACAVVQRALATRAKLTGKN